MFNIDDEIKKAKEDVVKLITKDVNRQKELLELSERFIKISFTDENTIGDTCFAASTKPIVNFKDDNIIFERCEITYPNLTYDTDINHYRVDLRHELFHAFTEMLCLANNLKLINDKLYFGFGGKVIDYTDIKNQNDLPATVLFNEIVTDISAYSSYYGKNGIGLESIINGNGLEQIEYNYGYGNGYFELLPLGKCIIKAFENYNCDYDKLQQKTYGAKYETSNNESIYYNDLLYGVMYNPLHTMEEVIKYTSKEDWNIMNDISKRILSLYEKNINPEYKDIKNILDLLAKYLNNKYARIENKVLKEKFTYIISNFNKSYNEALAFYRNNNSKSM